jgi:hypothetical protein
MKLITLQEHKSNLSAQRKPLRAHFNPDDTVVYFENEEDMKVFEAAEGFLKDSIGKACLHPDRILEFAKNNGYEGKAKADKVEEKEERKPSKDAEIGSWKQRSLQTLSSNKVNIQTLKKVLKETIERL